MRLRFGGLHFLPNNPTVHVLHVWEANQALHYISSKRLQPKTQVQSAYA